MASISMNKIHKPNSIIKINWNKAKKLKKRMKSQL